MRAVAAASPPPPGQRGGGAGASPGGRGSSSAAAGALAGAMECQKCKEHAKELKTQAAKLETMAQEMRKAQDREAKLREELSSIFVRLVQYNMCSVEELALLTQGLHLSGEYLEEEKSAIRREAGKDAPPEVLAAVRNKAEPVGGGGAAAFAKADVDPAATAKSAAKSVEEEQSERLLNESIFFGTARSFSNGEEMAARIKQLLVEVGAHKLRMGVVLKNKAKLSERAKKAETENKSMKKKVQETEKRLASSRLTTPAVAAGAAAKRVLMSPGSADKESTDDGGDTGEDEADPDPKRKLGKQRRVEKIVRKLDDLDRAKAVLTRSLSMETKLRIAAEEEVARLRDLLDRLRKSHRHQKLPEIEEANRLLNAQLGRAPSTANLEQRSPLSPSGDSQQLVERKYRTRERERLRGGVRGKHIGGGGLSSGSQSQILDERVGRGGIGGNYSAFPPHSLDSIEAEFASCPVQKLRLKREELRKEEEFLQQMARGLSGPMHHQGGSAAYHGAVGGGQNVNKPGGGAASYGQKPAGAGGGPGPVTQEPFLAHLRDKNMMAASDDHGAASKLLQ